LPTPSFSSRTSKPLGFVAKGVLDDEKATQEVLTTVEAKTIALFIFETDILLEENFTQICY